MYKVYLGILVILVGASVGLGQRSGQKRPPLAEGPQKGQQVSLASGTSISAQLQKTLDANNVEVGDQVVLKTTQSIRQDGDVIIPKGSTLIGRITDVKRRGKDKAESRIGMVFDRLEGKNLSMPLSATLVSITNAAANASLSNDSLMSDVSTSSRSSSSTSTGGGLLGGVTNTVGGLVNTTTQTVGTVTNTATQTVGTTTGTVGRTVNGLQISTEASGSANTSTTLSSPNKNVRVEKGATFHLRVAN